MISSTHSDVRLVPNTGWDERILMFQYKRIVTNFAVISERYVVLIDTLVSPSTAAVMVEAVRDRLREGRQLVVINTHADWDHYWGNGLFAGADARYPAPIIAHRLCRERVLGGAWQEYLVEMQQSDPATYAEVRLVPPTITFDGSCSIFGGDLTFELIHTPGHTPDHVSIFIPEIRTLFPVDAAEDPIPFVFHAEDVPLMRASFERLAALEPERVLYHHALGSTSTDVIQHNIAYFNDLERRATAAVQATPFAQALDENSDVEAIMGYPFAEVAHLETLNAEERTFYQGAHRDALRSMLEYVRQQH